ncbi:MAG: ankyrin repeat domain-containing protein [Acidobacteria bacterium]|nr:ankyrin repeat domain-containing protein [Acidobacteriota bacterium]
MRTLPLSYFLALPLFAQPAMPPAASVKIDYEKHVKPILAQKCHSCHGEDVQQSGLRLDKRQNAMRGGDYGPVINAGNSASSKLIRRVVSGDGGMQMPPTGPLSAEEIGILRAWIDQGVDFRIEIHEDPPAKPIDPKLAALITAIRSSDNAAVEKLAAPSLVNAADAGGSTPLHHAAAFGTMETMKLLLAKGAAVNAKNRRASTPLHWAIRDEAKVRLLLDAGADKDARQADGRSIVYQAASAGNANNMLRLLLDKGADPNAATANGQTPLINAAGRGDVEAMRLLLAKKADPHARSGTGGNALMAAANSRNPRAVELLLELGADPNAVTKKNESALANAATAGVEESVKLLLAKGAKVNIADDRGYTALMYAAASESMNASIVRLLLANGADTNCTGEGETVRTLAAKRGDSEVARLLGVAEAERKQGGVAAPESAKRRPVPAAVQQALMLLEKQSHNFIRTAGCNSCHAQDLPSAALGLARDRGIPTPKQIEQLPVAMTGVNAERLMDLGAVGVASIGWEMVDRFMNHQEPDDYTDATVHYLKLMQTPQGYWKGADGRRPPMNSGDLQATALAIYAIRNYSRPSAKTDTAKILARAAAWLETAKPVTTQERSFHLLALSWSGASSAVIDKSAKALAAAQRVEGGWSQLPAMGADAYATGQALYALHTAGKMPVSAAAYQKGVDYLLNSQAADGSWHVKTRSIWIQPYFESGFPYAHDQWISAAGTAWASMALSLTAEPAKLSKR